MCYIALGFFLEAKGGYMDVSYDPVGCFNDNFLPIIPLSQSTFRILCSS